MRLSTALHLTLVALLVTCLGVGTFAALPAAAQSSSAAGEYQQVLTIHLEDDGDARWTIEMHLPLEDDEDEAAFESYADALERGQVDSRFDPATFERFAEAASSSTGRSMAIEDESWDDPQVEETENGSVGVLTYSFTWTNFAETDGDTISLRDSFSDGDGYWLPAIAPDERLVIESAPSYSFDTAPGRFDDGALVWDGPHEFTGEDFEIVLAERPFAAFSNLLPYVAVGVVLLGAGAGAWYLLSRKPESIPWIDPEDLPSIGPVSTDGADDGPDPSAGTAAGATASTGDDGTTRTTDDAGGQSLAYDEPTEDVDVELLSDDERVHRLLRQNGGRMKQASIVKETGWSNAKVSQLLSQMDDDDEIEKLRIGRENLITHPEVDPTEID